ncbi:hypothetical protein [Yinghuangia sp. YIM S09857]|uniref:hypothetical protein n=1 Tax=Yinghuangia sp. YIM S09857 TaxID=3436929 RepID=UPI003F531868
MAAAVPPEAKTITECAGAPGPGDFHKHCIEVASIGSVVYKVHGYMQATIFGVPPVPAQICGVDVNIWGWKPFEGGAFERNGRNNECALGHLGLAWEIPGGQPLEYRSLVCTRVIDDPAHVPEPVCVRLP